MYTVEYLKNFTFSIFHKMGCNPEDADAISDVFIRAELRNLSSHGMIRIKDHYQLWKVKRINTKPDIRIIHETPATAVVDADNAVGMLAAKRSMETAIRKAGETGTAWVATRNSNHLGIGAYYALMAIERDMIGISMTNANALVAPSNSVSRLLGTNPITVAIPAGNEPPFVGDFSTTPIARGKLAVAAKRGEKVPFGYVQDKEGNPSDDPDIIRQGGAMLPLGSDLEHGSHKGYALGSIVDILSGVLSGANFGPFIPPNLAFMPMPEVQVGKGMGHFFGAIRIDGFMPAEEFKKRMDKWIQTFRNAKPIRGKKVRIPGDIEREAEIKIRKTGISILPSIQKDLKKVADELGVDFNMKRDE
ncbi:MAG: Ldh family oxidoreductase [Bacteroidales bacterium]|nr:MAG: Ldh family oxidoreductase [Bacteroidales bacterium]